MDGEIQVIWEVLKIHASSRLMRVARSGNSMDVLIVTLPCDHRIRTDIDIPKIKECPRASHPQGNQ